MVASLALVACGGDSAEDEYKEAFPPVSKGVVALGEEVGASIEGAGESSDEQLAEDFDGYAQRLDELEKDLSDLEPPDDLAEDQDALISAIDDVQGSLEQIAEAAQESDADAAREATIGLVEGSTALRDARRKLATAVRDL